MRARWRVAATSPSVVTVWRVHANLPFCPWCTHRPPGIAPDVSPRHESALPGCESALNSCGGTRVSERGHGSSPAVQLRGSATEVGVLLRGAALGHPAGEQAHHV